MKTPIEMIETFLIANKLPMQPGGSAQVEMTHTQVRTLLIRAVTQDRAADKPDFDQIINKVLKPYDHLSELLFSRKETRNLIRTALSFASHTGARFQVQEIDYTDAVGAACETFMSCLKDKGLFSL